MSELRDLLRDVFAYIRETQRWWLLPVAIVLILLGFLIVTGGTAPVPVFVYPVA